MKVHSEEAFEALIEQRLLAQGYVGREPGAYDAERALIPSDLTGFIAETQPRKWEKLAAILGANLEATVLDAFGKHAASQGALSALRHGFKVHGQQLRVATFKPAFGLNPQTLRDYEANRVAVVRQVHFDPRHPGLSVDMVLFVNGIPVATIEVKNALTSQSAADAMRQYRQDRDPDAPLFRFKRGALVHFAVGSDEVHMTTRLARERTRFLPFNRGHGTGAGNPPVPGGHRTAYLWEEVLGRESLLDLLARFLHLERTEEKTPDGKKHVREALVFPRYHQLDCVRRLVAAAAVNGPGTNYLVQHSAGSGKSNSIAWLAHRLSSLHDEGDRRVYDGVVVVTDRVVLDQQLQDTIFQFDHRSGVVRKIDQDSAQLARALVEKVPVIVTTIHKFGFIAEKIEALPGSRYAVIVDEAHSSQTGEMATSMKEILGASSIAQRLGEEEADDLDAPDQAALRAALARGPQANLSFFAFTATPKFKTLELFGHKDAAGRPAPFHLYSMRQAIEEEFILDVLRGYTTYKRYFALVKEVADDPEFDKRRAARALARFVSFHPVNVAQKTEVIVEHFRACVMNRLDRRAKAMVLADSRLAAVRYKQAFDAYVAEKGYTDVGVLVAFSGEVRDPDVAGISYTEPGMNAGTREKELPETFAGPDFNVLIVANKYQTGFDQPLLVAMYVDKRLSGIQAVQTLSRLNRTCPGKEGTFVLDFVNEREEILRSFQQYYEGTTTAEAVDPQRLHELEAELDQAQVYYASEVDTFAAAFFKANPTPRDNGILHGALDTAVDRFVAMDDEDDRERFRGRLQAFVNLYAFMAQIVPFSDVDLEKRYAFGRMLLRKLPRKGESSPPLDLGDDVALRYYRLEKVADGALGLTPEGTQEIAGPTETGTQVAETPFEHLSRLIDLINERFATDFDAQDLIDGVREQLVADEGMQQAARANTKENFRYTFEPALDEALVDRHAEHGRFIDRLFSDAELLAFFRRRMLEDVYRQLAEGREGA